MHPSVQQRRIVIQKLPLHLLFSLSTLDASIPTNFSRHGTSWRVLFKMLSREQCRIEEMDLREQTEACIKLANLLMVKVYHRFHCLLVITHNNAYLK